MTTLADFRRWSLRQKLRNPFAGLRLWEKTNVEHSRAILSLHWPHLLCWSWTLWGYGSKARRDYRKFGFMFNRHGNGGGQGRIGLGVIGFNFAWQDSRYMAALGRRGADAPKVDWDAERARRNA